MHGAAVVSWLLVALCGATGVYCLAVGRAGGAEPGAARIEAVMGLSMAAMALPRPPGQVSAAALAVLFTVLFAGLAVWSWWSLRSARHRGHGLHHALEALAMAYMAAVMAAGGGQHAGHGAGPGGIPLLTGVLLAYFAGYALYTGARMLPSAVALAAVVEGPGPSGAGRAAPGSGLRGGGLRGGAPGRAVRTGGVADACRLTLALGSFTMLLTL